MSGYPPYSSAGGGYPPVPNTSGAYPSGNVYPGGASQQQYPPPEGAYIPQYGQPQQPGVPQAPYGYGNMQGGAVAGAYSQVPPQHTQYANGAYGQAPYNPYADQSYRPPHLQQQQPPGSYPLPPPPTQAPYDGYATQQIARNAFIGADTDRSGYLDLQEFIAALRSLGINLVYKQALEYFARGDRDQSGRIGLNEFIKLYDEELATLRTY